MGLSSSISPFRKAGSSSSVIAWANLDADLVQQIADSAGLVFSEVSNNPVIARSDSDVAISHNEAKSVSQPENTLQSSGGLPRSSLARNDGEKRKTAAWAVPTITVSSDVGTAHATAELDSPVLQKGRI